MNNGVAGLVRSTHGTHRAQAKHKFLNEIQFGNEKAKHRHVI